MRLIIILCLYLFPLGRINAQTKGRDSLQKTHIALAPIVGLHVTTFNNSSDGLNSSLSDKKYPTLVPVFNSGGVALVSKTAKYYSFTELSIMQAMHDIDDRTVQYRFVPRIRGYAIRSILTKRLWEKGKKRIDGGFGMSVSKFNFKLIDRKIIQSPFDTLLNAPISASGSLDYAQRNFNWSLESRFGLTYNTKWFKKVADAYEFSFFIN